MQTVAPSLMVIDLTVANAYVIRSKNAVVLVDAGVRNSLPKIERALGQAKLGWRDISHIFMTHAHPDHVGNFPEIARLSGAEVWAHPLELPILRGEQPVKRPDPQSLRPVFRWMAQSSALLMPGPQATGPATGVLQADQHLAHILPDLRTVHLPGHSAGQMGFYHAGEGWLVGGDVMMNLVGLTFPLPSFTPDVPEAWRSILKVARIQPKILALGHGKVLREPQAGLQKMASRAAAALA